MYRYYMIMNFMNIPEWFVFCLIHTHLGTSNKSFNSNHCFTIWLTADSIVINWVWYINRIVDDLDVKWIAWITFFDPMRNLHDYIFSIFLVSVIIYHFIHSYSVSTEMRNRVHYSVCSTIFKLNQPSTFLELV